MADFYQTGVVTTLHRLTANNIERLESDLEKFSRNKPIGLVLPALYSEFETLAMQRIVTELRKVRYLQRIVVVPHREHHMPGHRGVADEHRRRAA